MAQLLTVMQILLSLIVGVYFFRQLRRDRDAVSYTHLTLPTTERV